MMGKSIFISMVLLLLCVPIGYSQEFVTEFPICTNSESQKSPAISGNIVVWMDGRNYFNSSNIYGLDLNTQTEFPICTNSEGQHSPAISGNIVVWRDNRNSWSDIYGYDLDTQTEFRVTYRYSSQTRPAISGNIVVWMDGRNNNFDIYGHDLNTQTEFPVCTNSESQESPAISGNIVVWTDRRNYSSNIYGYDLDTHTEFPICTHSGDQHSPAISGNIVVWTDRRNSRSSDIYGYDLDTQTEFPIYTNSGDQYSPAISGNIVVWTDSRADSDGDIYGYDLNTQTEFPVCTNSSTQESPAISGNVVVWRDSRNSSFDIYSALGFAEEECLNAVPVFTDLPLFGATFFATGSDISACGFNDTKGVWGRYSPSQGGRVMFSTDGSDFDTVLSVYNACGGEELICNDNYSLENTQSKIVMDVVKGRTYYIRIAGFNGQAGSYELLVSRNDCINQPQSDMNDDCSVNIQDFAILASEWLNCGLKNQADCP